jgi:membrane-bound serine protease (ClpP class)
MFCFTKKIILWTIFLVIFLLNFISNSSAEQIDIIKISDPITPAVAEFIVRSIDEAEASFAECIIIQIDTPGGLDLSMRQIVKKILSSRVPVVVYVSPSGARAASAGLFVTIAAHIAAMAPGTNIGAAHPVNMGDGDMGREMSEKVENDAAAYAESIALKRNRNKHWVSKAVRESVSISEVDALKKNVIDLISPEINKLIEDIDGRNVETASGMIKLNTKGLTVNIKKMGIRENVLKAISNPNIAYILLMIGIAGLYFELSNPGVIFPGVVGGLSLLLAFYSLQSLSANYTGVMLILLGVIFFILEFKVISYGLLSIAGIVAITIGSLMLFQFSGAYLQLSWVVIISSVGLMALFFIVLMGLIVKAQKGKPETGMDGLIGMTGKALDDFDKNGKVFVHGEYWDARISTPISKGANIRVVKAEGMMLTVEKVD